MSIAPANADPTAVTQTADVPNPASAHHALHADLPSLSEHVAIVVQQYLDTLGDEPASDLYALMLSQLEQPLLQVLLAHTRGNQSQVAAMLGMNRGTLRKKLKTYGLLK